MERAEKDNAETPRAQRFAELQGSENGWGTPHLFSELRILKDLREGVFGSAHSKGVMDEVFVTAHSKEDRVREHFMF